MNIRAKKINGSLWKIFRMIIAGFEVINKFNKIQLFQKTFLLANISM